MTYADPQHYHVKVRVYNESIDFGKGVAELLQRIEATGSLSAAYKAMGMSASKAWKILTWALHWSAARQAAKAAAAAC